MKSVFALYFISFQVLLLGHKFQSEVYNEERLHFSLGFCFSFFSSECGSSGSYWFSSFPNALRETVSRQSLSVHLSIQPTHNVSLFKLLLILEFTKWHFDCVFSWNFYYLCFYCHTFFYSSKLFCYLNRGIVSLETAGFYNLPYKGKQLWRRLCCKHEKSITVWYFKLHN